MLPMMILMLGLATSAAGGSGFLRAGAYSNVDTRLNQELNTWKATDEATERTSHIPWSLTLFFSSVASAVAWFWIQVWEAWEAWQGTWEAP